MKHIQALACGIHGYSCVGILDLLFKRLPVIGIHSVNYDRLSVPASGSVLDLIANNFYNLPTSILGVINQTPYNDLQGVGLSVLSAVGRCRASYDPFELPVANRKRSVSQDSPGLLDFFGLLVDALIFPTLTISQYGPGIMLKPGILLPRTTLSPFNPTPIVTLPSWVGVITNSVINTPAIAGSQRIAKAAIGSNQSPCLTGFQILALLSDKASAVPRNYQQMKRSKSATILVNITAGKVDISGTIVLVPSNKKNLTMDSSDITNKIDSVLVYVNVLYNFQAGQYLYKGHTYIQDGLAVPHTSKFSIWAYIGSISVYCQSLGFSLKLCALNVTQPLCSPIMIQDAPLSQLPNDDDDATVYVYSYKSKSNLMGWMAVKDC